MNASELSAYTAELVRRIRPTSTITHNGVIESLDGFSWPGFGDKWSNDKLYELAARVSRRVDGKFVPVVSSKDKDDYEVQPPAAKRAKITEYKLDVRL